LSLLMSREALVPAIDRAALTGPVRGLLGSDTAEIETWDHDLLYGGLGVAKGISAVYRVAGTACDGGATKPWSLVLKILRDPTHGSGPGEEPRTGWDREVRVYRSGLLDDLPAGLVAARCYGIEERPGAAWLWLEDVADEIGPHWPIARFALAARHLGRLSGRYLTERPLPDDPWLLLHGLLPSRAAVVAGFWDDFERVRDDPLARRIWPGDLSDRALRLWHERDWVLAAIERLPQSFVHGDADRRNLFARHSAAGEEETVAIDWALAGVLPLGAELPLLVTASVLWAQEVGPGDLGELADSCLAGYVAGLADVGWHGDPRLVETGFAATAALRHGPLWGAVELVGMTPEQRAPIMRTMGGSIEEFADRWAAVQRFAYDRLDAVRGVLEVACPPPSTGWHLPGFPLDRGGPPFHITRRFPGYRNHIP
jgi:hypothetical protein